MTSTWMKCGQSHMAESQLELSVPCVHAKWLQSCPALCDPIDCSPPGSSVHGILQARILESVAISFSRGSSQPRDQTCVSCMAAGFFTTSTIWDARLCPAVLRHPKPTEPCQAVTERTGRDTRWSGQMKQERESHFSQSAALCLHQAFIC